MARACIMNVNDHGVLLAEYLKASGRIERWESKDAWICFEFGGELTITFDDWLEVYPRKENLTYPPLREKAREWFKKEIQVPMVKTLRGGGVSEFIPGERITVKSTEKTATICVRVTLEEKERIETEARKLGVTVSDLIRNTVIYQLTAQERK